MVSLSNHAVSAASAVHVGFFHTLFQLSVGKWVEHEP